MDRNRANALKESTPPLSDHTGVSRGFSEADLAQICEITDTGNTLLTLSSFKVEKLQHLPSICTVLEEALAAKTATHVPVGSH